MRIIYTVGTGSIQTDIWPYRPSVRTQDFHSWKSGSTPLRATLKYNFPPVTHWSEFSPYKRTVGGSIPPRRTC